jgi:GNAT superfamily N-acetyltransferase
MALKIVTHVERPDLVHRWNELGSTVWPEFGLHDATVDEHWNGLTRHFPECQLYLLDDQSDEMVGVGNTVPVVWDGTADGLPVGLDDVLIAAIGQRESQPPPTTLCALQAAVMPGHQGTGLSRVIIGAMREVAVRLGLSDLIAPVRPNQKPLYPLTPIERYIQWRRPDGLPQDPWLRVHARLGAEIVKVANPSMTIQGTVAEWESWTGLVFPDSGQYVVAGALTLVTIDVEADVGLYVEPNVWMRHRLDGS